MNLMFWRKKAGADEEPENARENLAVNAKPQESLDFVAAKTGIAERSPEPPEPESSGSDEAGPETPPKPGLAARIKSRFNTLAQHFRRPPAFRADEEHAPDTLGSTEEPETTAPVESDPEAPDLETPAKPALGVRIKLLLIAFVRRFRKTPAPDVEEGQADEADEQPKPEAPAKPGLFLRIKAAFAAFIRELKAAPAAPAADEEEEAGSHGRSEALPEDELPEGEPAAGPARSRKWLVVGGSVAIVVLLAVDIAITLWLAYEPSQKRWGTRHNITSISSRPADPDSAPEESPASAPEKSQVEAEALKRQNAELQARIEALKRGAQQRQVYAPPTGQAGGNASSSSVGGEMTVGSKDPKATAMSLKEAIDAMNAGSGDYDKKPAK